MRLGLTRPSRHWARIFALAVVAAAAALLLPFHFTTRVVIGWDAGVAVYLALVWRMMATATVHDIRSVALAEDESPWAVTSLLVGAACASLLAIAVVITTSATLEPVPRRLYLGLAACTILLSWLLVQTVYAVHYAHVYYGNGASAGLKFPNGHQPIYTDFAYFAFVIGMTCQVADVVTTSSAMRHLALVHGIISFFFNTILIALSVNIAASFL